MISKIERIIAFRYLKPKKKEGFLKVISIFSFTGIALGVAILIIVMSVMNGFRTELINKILGFNPHIIVKSYNKEIKKEDLNNLDELKEDILRTAFTFSGQGILINKKNTTGILVRSYLENDIDKIIGFNIQLGKAPQSCGAFLLQELCNFLSRFYAAVVEMVDTPDLGSGALWV